MNEQLRHVGPDQRESFRPVTDWLHHNRNAITEKINDHRKDSKGFSGATRVEIEVYLSDSDHHFSLNALGGTPNSFRNAYSSALDTELIHQLPHIIRQSKERVIAVHWNA